ncbi:lipopolysaccharide biosynthesis protein [Geodermatophilus sabuli]|uniref:Polysaccharide transporter, PST family n=1 Tax=Geodermatophilus sabuli TaxID=1564158 RepID=A0A285ED64_9ACTN|nr:lipopolysaccharide biosynthesis protein [Geodermatophilus sabuli]MBB3084753.1 PST family polysaccharide transporter [Geodermatophilus sabuli]SNX97059.1 polysaccharide transporter, PST family [Geodermatophilus sabuli]
MPSGDRTALHSFLWSGLSFGVTKLAVFASTLVLARILVPDDFGVVAAAMTVIALFEIGLDLGVGSALIHDQERGITSRVQTAFTLNLGIAALLTAVFVLCAPAVAAYFRVPESADVFRAVAFYLLLRGAGQVQDAVLRRDLQFRRRTLAELARAVTRFGVSIPLALLDHGVWALVWGLLAAEVAGTIVNWVLVPFLPRFTVDRTAVRTLLSFGLAVVAVQAVSVVSSNADYLAVGRVLGPEDLGQYTMAYRLPELLIDNVYWIFSSIALPWYSRARDRAAGTFKDTMLRALTLLTLFGFPMGAALALVARDAIPVLFSEQWLPAVGPMALLALAAGVNAIGFASGDIFPALGQPGLLLRLDLVFAATEIAAFFLLARHGILVVAAVHLVSGALYMLLRLVVANRLVGTGMRECGRAMVPGVAVTVGITACALPLLFLLQPGVGSLLAVIGAGVVGAALGAALGARDAITDVVRTVAAARGR